jgi:hypothetical protein
MDCLTALAAEMPASFQEIGMAARLPAMKAGDRAFADNAGTRSVCYFVCARTKHLIRHELLQAPLSNGGLPLPVHASMVVIKPTSQKLTLQDLPKP